MLNSEYSIPKGCNLGRTEGGDMEACPIYIPRCGEIQRARFIYRGVAGWLACRALILQST